MGAVIGPAHGPSIPRLLTVGHGTLPADDLGALLTAAAVELVVDVRTAPGSRRHPHVSRDQLGTWLPDAGIGYRWEPDLGGWRKARADSPHTALRDKASPSSRSASSHAGQARVGNSARQRDESSDTSRGRGSDNDI